MPSNLFESIAAKAAAADRPPAFEPDPEVEALERRLVALRELDPRGYESAHLRHDKARVMAYRNSERVAAEHHERLAAERRRNA